MLTTARNPETMPTRDDDRRLAVQRRDRTRDGEFVFAVSTTGVYCRPSCPARRPRPEHVRFFCDAAAAERAGFRACRRCRPRAQATAQEDLVARATAWLDAHAAERVTLPRLAGALGVSPGHLQRTFTRIVGVSPRAYLAARRLETAKMRLREGDGVASALYGAGYTSSSRFYAQARDALGMMPSIYKRGGDGMTIAYGTTSSPLGRVLVAATERGVCAVSIGEGDAELETWLAEEYPRATMRRDDDAVRRALTSIAEYLENQKPLPRLPLDVLGTPFQRNVWGALRAIPCGERRTYGELAVSLGLPRGARAVANACAANPAALVIPCHRVVPASGSTGGYRWGAERKRELLAAEGETRVSGCQGVRVSGCQGERDGKTARTRSSH
jgi:AraC family transcriptional regulator of adaptative response/methylated-DNA-[protein]-cysteine methyltransferase